MSFHPASSRDRYRHYRRDLEAHETEGSRGTAAAHAKSKQRPHGEGRHVRSFFRLFAAFWSFLRGSRRNVMIALGTATVATALKLIPPAAIGFVLDCVLGAKPIPADLAALGLPTDRDALIAIVAIGIVAIAIASIVIGMTGRYLATVATKRVQGGVRKRVFGHAVRLPLHRIYALRSGGAASMLREDAGGVAELLFSMLYNPWRAIVQLFGTVAILAFIDWRLLVGSVVIIPIVYYTHKAWIARIRPLWKDIRHSRETMDAHATEAFGGMRVVRSFGRQRTETGRFIRNNHFMIRQEMFAWWASRTVEVAWAIAVPAASAALLFYGGHRILGDEARLAEGLIAAHEVLTTGDLVMFLFYLAMLLEPLETLASSATTFQNGLAGLDRVLDLLEEPQEFTEQTGGAAGGSRPFDPRAVRGEVVLRDVSFVYPNTKTAVVRAVDLEVEPGSVVAFVGPSGSGKTTLCNLIARFYDPTEGVIRLDGRDIREIDVERYRRILGIVEQDIFLFDGTVGANIAYGRRGANRAEITRAAELAHASEFVERLDRGYETIIGERGVRLSGGQRQRLAIARALLADPRLLILDEATSNLDTESERLIQESLERLLRGRTSFVIAHRLSTITYADLIVVLEGGAITERGTHDELMARSGTYRRMVEMQLVGRPPKGTHDEPSIAALTAGARMAGEGDDGR